MYDPISGRPRLNWDPVNDGGARRVASGDGGGFHFDLGGALARLGGDPEPPGQESPASAVAPIGASIAPPPPLDPLPSRARVTPQDQVPTAPLTARFEEPLDPLPRRGERHAEPYAPMETPVQQAPSNSQASARRSVFDDIASAPASSLPPSIGAPSMPSIPSIAPSIAQSIATPPPTSRRTFVEQPTATSQSAVATATLVDVAPVLAGGAAPFLPTLPPPKPVVAATPAPVVEQVAGSADLNALRAAQRRSSRQQRQGKMFGRTLLVLLGVGGLIAAALMFGRPYLYPTEWDAALTPIVDQIQTERGREFDHTVGLVEQPAAEYAATVGRLAFDDAWLDDVPMWRALGMASGEPTIDSVGAALAPRRLAVYDPDADRIYLLADSGVAADADLRVALERAFAVQHDTVATVDDQVVTGFTGVSSRQQLATAAVHDHLVAGSVADSVADSAAEPVADAESPAAVPADTTAAASPPSPLPLPLEYELTAVEHLGPGLIARAGLDRTTTSFETSLSDELGAALDDLAVSTAAGTLQPGDRSLAPPISLGNDDWSLVWGARLPEASVDHLVDVVVADSYRTIDRAGVICVVGVFETAVPSDAAFVLSRMQSWVAGGPADSQASATAVGDTRVQFSSCDPGAEAATPPIAGAADALVNRQLERLTS